MKIGGLQRFSLIDYPGRICAIIFMQGCNFQCPYCHNPELSNPALYEPCINENDVLSFLDKRRGKLDAVTITGGEPTLQSGLVAFIKKIKKMGYQIKIDTNGSCPQILNELISKKLVQYIAMDIKAPLDKYEEITKSFILPETIIESIKVILTSGIQHEFRTTIVKSLLSKDDIISIGCLISGAYLYVLQRFVPSKVLNPLFLKEITYSEEDFNIIKKELATRKIPVTLR